MAAAPTAITDRDHQFLCQQYGLYFGRTTELQKEREVWIRHSIISTFAFFGWIAVYLDNITSTFMLQMFHLQLIYFLPLIFNLGGAVRFFFIQRDINRHVEYLIVMEQEMIQLPAELANAAHGRGIRDRHWHPPSVLYWLFIISLSSSIIFVLV